MLKVQMTCHECMKENIQPPILYPFVLLEVRDDGRYEYECPRGHENVFILQNHKFEVLFQIGAHAILDGYYREAVSSFSSSLERFYEVFIRVILLSKGTEQEYIQDTWKKVTNQSERQLGAFIFLYLQEFGKKPLLLNDSNINFRNKIVHKGGIPSRNQSIDYGQSVLDVVRPLLSVLKDGYSEFLDKELFHYMVGNRIEEDEDRPVGTIGMSTIIDLSNRSISQSMRTLEEELLNLDRCRKN